MKKISHNAEKKSHNAEKKLEGGDPLGFFNIHSVAKFQKKTERGTLWEIFFSGKKSRNAETERGNPSVLFGVVCYAGNILARFLGPTGTIWRLLKILVKLLG